LDAPRCADLAGGVLMHDLLMALGIFVGIPFGCASMTFTTQIGSGRQLFILPGGKFINITKAPLALGTCIKETNK
jgi:hypothetical protein